jgi:hypothetical protein
VAILVGERDCWTQFWKRTIQWLFHQSLVLIELLVPDKMVFMWISHRVLCSTKVSCAAILVRGWDQQTQFWKRIIQWLFYQSLVPIEQLVPDKKICMWIYHRVLFKLSSGVGDILVEGPNRQTHFWKRTIQWLFHQNLVLIKQMVSEKKIFMGFPIVSYVK